MRWLTRNHRSQDIWFCIKDFRSLLFVGTSAWFHPKINRQDNWSNIRQPNLHKKIILHQSFAKDMSSAPCNTSLSAPPTAWQCQCGRWMSMYDRRCRCGLWKPIPYPPRSRTSESISGTETLQLSVSIATTDAYGAPTQTVYTLPMETGGTASYLTGSATNPAMTAYTGTGDDTDNPCTHLDELGASYAPQTFTTSTTTASSSSATGVLGALGAVGVLGALSSVGSTGTSGFTGPAGTLGSGI